jgi:hypothetical protein
MQKLKNRIITRMDRDETIGIVVTGILIVVVGVYCMLKIDADSEADDNSLYDELIDEYKPLKI